MGFRVQGLGLRVKGLGFGVWVPGFGVLECRAATPKMESQMGC